LIGVKLPAAVFSAAVHRRGKKTSQWAGKKENNGWTLGAKQGKKERKTSSDRRGRRMIFD